MIYKWQLQKIESQFGTKIASDAICTSSNIAATFWLAEKSKSSLAKVRLNYVGPRVPYKPDANYSYVSGSYGYGLEVLYVK